jgi:hypothetical protein
MAELIKQGHGNIGADQAAAFLRDRELPGGAFPGDGHRGTLNAFIATHAVVMDLTDGIFWAASPPNQLGKFVAFDVQDFSRELPDRTIAADPALASGEYEKAQEAQKCLADGFRALEKHEAQTALDMAVKAESLNPGFYRNATLEGRALLGLRRRTEAARAFTTALAEKPAFLKEKLDLEALLQQAQTAR